MILDTGVLIIVCTAGSADLHRLVPVPGWRPDLLDIPTRDRHLVGFTDELVGTTVTLDVLSDDGSIAGYLMPTGGRCALCHHQRHITVRRWTDHPTDDDADTLAVYDPGTDTYRIDTRIPCPACRYIDYALSRNDRTTDAEDQR